MAYGPCDLVGTDPHGSLEFTVSKPRECPINHAQCWSYQNIPNICKNLRKLDPLDRATLRWFLVSLVWCPAPATEPALGQGQRRPHGGGGWDADGGQAQSEIHLVAWRGWWAATWARNRALQIWMGEVGNTDQQIWDVGFSQLYPKNLVHFKLSHSICCFQSLPELDDICRSCQYLGPFAALASIHNRFL